MKEAVRVHFELGARYPLSFPVRILGHPAAESISEVAC